MPRIGLRLPDLLAFSAKQLSQPPPLADRYEIMAGLRSIGIDLGLDRQILQHPLGGDAARQRFDGGFAMWHLARILRRTAGDLFPLVAVQDDVAVAVQGGDLGPVEPQPTRSGHVIEFDIIFDRGIENDRNGASCLEQIRQVGPRSGQENVRR